MSNPMFPVPHQAQSRGADDVKWFAGLAMQAIIARHGIPSSDSTREEIALWSYRMGQEMAKTEQRLHAVDELAGEIK